MQFDTIIGLIQKGCVLLLNFADDIILATLPHLGITWAWLQYLSTILFAISLLYWSYRICRFVWHRYQSAHA